MNTTKKITKRECYEALIDIVSKTDYAFDTISSTELIDFINHEIELLNNRAATSAKRARARREEGDALRERVLEILSTDKFMTINEVTKAFNDDDITVPMVTARLTQLVKADLAEKDNITIERNGKSKKFTAYRKI